MVSVFLMMLLVVTALASSAWAEGKIQPFYNQTARISASLVINGSTAECMGKIIPNSDATVSSMTMKLQQKNELDWTPQYAFKEALDETVAWYRSRMK